MKNYQQAMATLNGRKSKKVDNNTYLEPREDGAIAVKLHQTDVVTFKKDSSIVFNSGGWRTVTTKDRMNKFSPCRISQAKGQWYIDGKPYHDGIEYREGTVNAEITTADLKKEIKGLKKARKYCKEYMDNFFNKSIPAPSGGDCWGCAMVSEDGKTAFGSDHIHQHIEEGYFVPSLLIRAVERFPVSPMAKNAFYYAWNPEAKEDMPDYVKDIARDQLEKSLYRYVKTAFNLAA